MEILAVIPARGGSKRLPGKNIKLMDGKPLIYYTIQAWKQSRYYKRPALVLSDSDEIGTIAKTYGTEWLKEPVYLANGNWPHLLIKHVIESLAKYQGYRAAVVVLLQPTSPLRTAEDIDSCLDLYFSGKGDSVTSVFGDKENGAVYITHASLVDQGSIYGQRVIRYEMPEDRSMDIDTLEDFEKAGRILKGDDLPGHINKLDRPEPGKGDDKGRKRMRGRPSKRATI